MHSIVCNYWRVWQSHSSKYLNAESQWWRQKNFTVGAQSGAETWGGGQRGIQKSISRLFRLVLIIRLARLSYFLVFVFRLFCLHNYIVCHVFLLYLVLIAFWLIQ